MNKTVEQKLSEGRQYRSFEAGNFERKSDGDSKVVKGYATTFNEPYPLYTDEQFTIREQIDPHAFDETNMEDVILQFDHGGRVFARTANGTLRLFIDEHGLGIEAELGGTEIGRQLYEEISGGYVTKMSFGFRVKADKREEVEEDGHIDVLRTITQIEKLYDVSAVSLPANDGTSISARSYAEGVIAEVKEEIHAREQREAQKERIRKILKGETDGE